MLHSPSPKLSGPAIGGSPAGSTSNKTVLAALIILLVVGLYLTMSWLACSTALAAGFSDLQGSWAAPEIAKAVDTGFIKGYPDGRFKPNAGVTRAEFVAMADNAFQVATVQNPSAFRDVRPSDWFSSNVRAAVAAGFVNGYPDSTFRPQQAVNRQEAATMLAQVLKLQDGAAPGFKDASQIDGWAKPFVGKLAANNITAGYPDGTWRPQKVITRAEAVVLINKALASQTATPAPAAPSRSNAGALAIKVSNDKYGEKVDITVNQGGNCQLTEQKDPQRLVVTVPGVTVVRTPLVISVGQGGLDKVTTRFPGETPGSAEVEISFTAPVPLYYYTSPGTPGKLLITVPPQIYKIDAAAVSGFLAVNLWATAPLNLQTSRLSNPPQLAFDFPGCSLNPNLQAWQQQVSAGEVDSLSLNEPQPQMVRLLASAPAEVTFTSDSSNRGQQLVLRLQKSAAPISPGNTSGTGNLAGKQVVLDPGHGGNDPGAVGPHGVLEKVVNLAITSGVADILRQQGANVIMTRDGDTNPDLYARADVANNASADIFVSIHSNSSNKASMGGSGTYTYAPAGTTLGQQRTARLKLASCLQEDLTAALGLRSCGIFENRFAVLRCTNMPAALVEVAFISNSREEHLLNDSDFQQQAATAIAHGITRFLTGG